MLAVRLIPAARVELIAAQDWYEGEAPGLGRRFRAEIDSTVQRIASAPLQFPAVFKGVRRARVSKFPYMPFFCIDGDELLVIACFHSRRDPQSWQSRV